MKYLHLQIGNKLLHRLLERSVWSRFQGKMCKGRPEDKDFLYVWELIVEFSFLRS